MPENWLLPTGHADPDEQWRDEENAYDGSTSSFAQQQRVPARKWSSWLHLTLDKPTECSGVRFFANINKFDSYDRVRVEVRSEGEWIEVFKGDFENREWNEAPFNERVIDQARICFYNREGIPFVRAELYEFEFWQTVKPGLAVAVPVGPMLLGGGTGCVIGLATGKPKYAVIGAAVGAAIALAVTVKPTREQLDDFPLLYPEEV